MHSPDLMAGAENLLFRCGGLTAGDQLLVVCEMRPTVIMMPRSQGLSSTVPDRTGSKPQFELSIRTHGPLVPEELKSAMKSADCTLFLSRTGDQIRFDAGMEDVRPIMSYALDAGMLASGFGRANYTGFVELKNAVNTLLANAGRIHVTCPLGTTSLARAPPSRHQVPRMSASRVFRCRFLPRFPRRGSLVCWFRTGSWSAPDRSSMNHTAATCENR